MANNTSTNQNLQGGANPFDWSQGGVGGKANQLFDPFNFTGWEGKKPLTGPTALQTLNEYQSPFQTVYDPNTMNLTPEVQKYLDTINTQPLADSVDQFRQMALRKGPSQWATLAGKQQQALESGARERGANEVAGQTAQAQADLASHGGLSSGAKERAAEGGAKNYMAMSQDLARQGNLNQMQIGINDEQNKIQQMGMLPGMENQALQPLFQKEGIWGNAANQNIQNTMNENQYLNQWNQNLSSQRMQAAAADRQAQATQNAGKK